MRATDYPHPDCLFPDSQQIIEQQLGGLPRSTTQKIICDNAVKLYNLG